MTSALVLFHVTAK